MNVIYILNTLGAHTKYYIVREKSTARQREIEKV